MLITDLHSQLALVTGATGGIGRATCLALANLGCNIAAHYHTAEKEAEELVQELRDIGVGVEAFQADLREYDEVRNNKSEILNVRFRRPLVQDKQDLYCSGGWCYEST